MVAPDKSVIQRAMAQAERYQAQIAQQKAIIDRQEKEVAWLLNVIETGVGGDMVKAEFYAKVESGEFG